ncbi:N-acyl-phosphatidylethanolamine-hydrolyzing phospholipase D [Tolypocladium capitatum]|uniref:N-acyl-phosphatidylethanolamine-hydrolyzing phospholipase D n=1 Tax=Tolypocladium capitatum TaxID=45235 RepID=A0A2K3QBA3_9HYPO|nr:N-acyl-phosphatidylethanolamine-hydrolyzing phospholipase D [Tolypocladium capitatum]
MASTTSSTAALATAASSHTYSTTVSKAPGRASRPEEAEANPHHVVKGGSVSGFKNPYPSYPNVNLGTMFRNVIWPIITGDLKQPDTSPPTVPVVTPEWLPGRTASGKLRATWLGHACYYVEFASGLRVLFDPVFEDRCSPFTFMGPKRFTPRPCDIRDIPLIDAVVISHSHYDHLSHASVLEIQRSHPDVQFFVGLGLAKWFRRSGLRNVTELDWWEDAELTVEVTTAEGEAKRKQSISARVSCLPCQHTSARSPFDRDTTLWCSWAVRSGDRSVWFGGDTGYRAVPRLPAGVDDYGPGYESLPRCPQFAQIGALRGPFDLGLIPIGAYYPRVAFSGMHANPFDSVEIFRDTRCARAMGIHWGTWALTMEEVLEPPRVLREALRRRGIPETGVFDVCDIGESREF